MARIRNGLPLVVWIVFLPTALFGQSPTPKRASISFATDMSPPAYREASESRFSTPRKLPSPESVKPNFGYSPDSQRVRPKHAPTTQYNTPQRPIAQQQYVPAPQPKYMPPPAPVPPPPAPQQQQPNQQPAPQPQAQPQPGQAPIQPPPMQYMPPPMPMGQYMPPPMPYMPPPHMSQYMPPPVPVGQQPFVPMPPPTYYQPQPPAGNMGNVPPPTPLPPPQTPQTPNTAPQQEYATIVDTSETLVSPEDPSMYYADVFWKETWKGCGIFAHASYLLLSVRGADVPFARLVTEPTFANSGPIGVADPGFSPGFRVGGGGKIGEKMFLKTTFSWFSSENADDLAANANQRMFPLVDTTGVILQIETGISATSRYDIEFRMVDVELQRVCCDTKSYAFSFLAGLRYAHLDQDFSVTFNQSAPFTATSEINFDGLGPRLGVAGHLPAHHGLFLYGNSTANFLFGHFGSQYKVVGTDFMGDPVTSRVDFGDDRLVTVLDMELGVGWVSPRGFVRLKGGYTAAIWLNAMTTTGSDQLAIPGLRVVGNDVMDTLTFDGLITSVEVRY